MQYGVWYCCTVRFEKFRLFTERSQSVFVSGRYAFLSLCGIAMRARFVGHVLLHRGASERVQLSLDTGGLSISGRGVIMLNPLARLPDSAPTTLVVTATSADAPTMTTTATVEIFPTGTYIITNLYF